MSDPLSLVPLALAARGGVIDGWPVRQLVAAGVGVLRGSAPLVRALAGRRSAILLPPGPLLFTAFAASDGRTAVLLDPGESVDPERVANLRVGACFTTDALQGLLPVGLPRVLLDGAPSRAQYIDRERLTGIDLAMHDGVALEGDPDTAGSNEEMLLVPAESGSDTRTFTHRALLVRARRTIAVAGLAASDHVLVLRGADDASTLAAGEVAALLAGGRVTTGDPRDAARAVERLEQLVVTVITARAAALEALVTWVEGRGTRVDASALRAIVCAGAQLPDASRARWTATTGLDVTWITAPDA